MDIYDYFDFENKKLKRIEHYSQEELENITNFLIELGSLYVLENTEKKLNTLIPTPEKEIKKVRFYRAILHRFKSTALTPSAKKEDIEKILKNFSELDYYINQSYPAQTIKDLENLYTNYYKELKKPINPEIYKALEREVKAIAKVILTEKEEIKRLAESYLEDFIRSFYNLNLKPNDLEILKRSTKLEDFLERMKEELKVYRIEMLNKNFQGYMQIESIQEITEEELFIISNLDPFKYHDFQQKIYENYPNAPLKLKAKLAFYENAKENYKKLKYQKSTNDSISYT